MIPITDIAKMHECPMPGADAWNARRQSSFLEEFCKNCQNRKGRDGEPVCATYNAMSMANSLGRTQWSEEGCLYVKGGKVACRNNPASYA